MMRRKLVWAGTGVLAILTLVFAHEGHHVIPGKGVHFGPRSQNLLMEPPARKAIGLETAKVDFATIEETLRAPARVVLPGDRRAFATARIGGIIESLNVKPGDRVDAGEVLAEISSIELEGLQLEITHLTLEKKQVEENLKRARDLGVRIVAGKEILELETELREKDNALSLRREKLQAIGLTAGQIRKLDEEGTPTRRLAITAPIAGHVLHVDAQIGALVAHDRHLIDIHDSSTVWIEGHLPERRAAEVRPGMVARITLTAYPGRVFDGKVERLGVEVTKTRTVSAWVSLENPGHVLKPGQFGEMTVVLGVSEGAFAAPAAAIVEDGAEKYAIVLVKKDTFVAVDAEERTEVYSDKPQLGWVPVNAYARKNVVVGRSNASLVEIREGLYPGDTVVVAGNHEISSLYAEGALHLSEEAKKNIRLATEEIDFRTVDEGVRLNAMLRVPVDRSAVASGRIHGKILKIHVVPGQEVAKGDPLASVHSLELDTLQLDYRSAALREKLLLSLLEPLRTLAQSGISSRKELLRLETDHRSQRSTLLSLRRRLELLGLKKEQIDSLTEYGERVASLPITAPIAGRVVDIHVVLGQVVEPEDHLFRIADTSVLWAEANVFERDFEKALRDASGAKAVLRLAGLPGRERETRISFVSKSLSDHEKTLPIFAELENKDSQLRPGMIGEMLVLAGTPGQPVIAAPNRALLPVGGRLYAFVESGTTFKRVEVKVGRRGVRYTEVLQGLFPGDRVAVSGVNELNTAIQSLK